MLICQWMSDFILRTVRAIAKARKIVQISICVFDLQRYIYVILSRIKVTYPSFKRIFVIHFRVFRYTFWWCIVKKKVKVKFKFWDDFSCFVEIVEYFHLTSIQKRKRKDGTLKRDRHLSDSTLCRSIWC